TVRTGFRRLLPVIALALIGLPAVSAAQTTAPPSPGTQPPPTQTTPPASGVQPLAPPAGTTPAAPPGYGTPAVTPPISTTPTTPPIGTPPATPPVTGTQPVTPPPPSTQTPLPVYPGQGTTPAVSGAPDLMAPREPLPAPLTLRFITPSEIPERELGIEEAVAIALVNQPTIQTRAASFLAAQQRVAEALSPPLPQLSGQWNGFRTKNSVTVTGASGQSATVSVGTSTTATVTASQLLFDFGKNWAATDAARAASQS